MNIKELFSKKGNTNNFFVVNIENKTQENENYREVLYTGNNMQLVIMSLSPGEEIGEEVHEDGDQFIRIESGTGLFVLEGKEFRCSDGDITLIPSGVLHNVINDGDVPLKLYALYSPPEHEDGTISAQKE